MFDQVVRMYGITRDEVLAMMEAQLVSLEREREKLRAAQSEGADVIINADRENIRDALAMLDDKEEETKFERDHLLAWEGPREVAAAQLRELRTRYAEILLPPVERLRLVIDAGKQLRAAMHNQHFRQPRV